MLAKKSVVLIVDDDKKELFAVARSVVFKDFLNSPSLTW